MAVTVVKSPKPTKIGVRRHPYRLFAPFHCVAAMKVVPFSRDFSFRRIGKFRWVFGAAATLAFTACGNSFTSVQPSELIVRIEGLITVAGTGDPIEGVLIEVRTQDASVLDVSTDSLGFYTLSFLYRLFPEGRVLPLHHYLQRPWFSGSSPLPVVLGGGTNDRPSTGESLDTETVRRSGVAPRLDRSRNHSGGCGICV